MIKFNGIGSAFNTSLGNTSAYIIENDTLLLIDCGCTVFHRLNERGLLNKIRNVYVLITHTHPDHAGSLGDLIFYVYYIIKGKVNVVFRDREQIEKYFSCIGVIDDMYLLNDNEEVSINQLSLKVKWVRTKHIDTMPSYSIYLTKGKETIYYSGDSSELSNEVLDKLITGKISKIYQDTCSFDVPGNPHTSLKSLCEVVDFKLRNKIFCMHLDSGLLKEDILEKGFNVAEIE